MSAINPPPHEFLPTRRSLVKRLSDWDDQEAWREFFETYWRLIHSVALKAGLNEPDAQDIVQETVVAVARKMRKFHYDPAIGSFKTWLMLIVRSRVADHLRRCRCRIQAVSVPPADTGGTSYIDRLPDVMANKVEAVWDEEWRKGLFDAALQRVRQKVAPKQYQIFDLYVLQQVPPSKIIASFGLSLGQLYLTKHRVGRLIKKEVERLENKML
jgi:RNA polymerase sigma factor (sigma-70 family)